jgi:DNA polymerase-1
MGVGAPEDHSGERLFRRTPHVILTAGEVKEAVTELLEQPIFVFDIETDSLDARNNNLLWVGLGGPAKNYLIPTGHPKGFTIRAEHKEKTAACLFYPEGDERRLTPKTGKPSWKMIEHTVDATYAPSPKQLYPHQVMEMLEPLMFSDRGILGHSVKFDLQSVAKYYDGEIPPGPYHDTILVKHTLVEDLNDYGLKELICDWFGIHPAKRKAFYPNLGKAGIERFGMDEVARYLAKDLRYCWQYFNRLHPLLERRGVQQVYDFEMTVYAVIMKMEQHGFPVSLDKVEKVRTSLNDQIAEVEAEIYEIADDSFSMSNLDLKRWVLFGEWSGEGAPLGDAKRPLVSQKLRVWSRTKKQGVPSVTQTVLDFYAERGVKIAELFKQWSELEKLRGTFIGHPPDPTAKDEDDRPPTGLYRFAKVDGGVLKVHTGYKQHGTVTGRLSATTPNLQQLPREMEGRESIRDLFVPAPGHVLVVADYDQVELRCAGYLAKDPNMIEVFKNGEDIHRRAAAAMFGCLLEEVTADMRHVGKTQNFATLYGAGPDKIAAVAGCSVEHAEIMIEGYYEEFQLLERWKARELQKARKNGDRKNPDMYPPYVEIPPNGRKRRLPDLFIMDYDRDPVSGKSLVWRRHKAERQAINAIVQGFASNITKLAMLDLDQVLPKNAAMLAQVHDEIVVQAPEEDVDVVMRLVAATMGGVTDPRTGKSILGEIPLVASAATGNSWSDAKRKAA